jgi:hypothetical protein
MDASKTVFAGQQLWSRGARGRYRRALSSAGGRSPRTGAQRRLAARALGGGHLSHASAIAVRICDENSALAPAPALEAMEADLP